MEMSTSTGSGQQCVDNTPVFGTESLDSPIHGSEQEHNIDPKARPDYLVRSSSYSLDAKSELMCNWLRVQQLKRFWSVGGVGEGVLLRKERGTYTSCPPYLATSSSDLCEAIEALNIKCALTMRTKVISLILTQEGLSSMPLDTHLYLQILPNLAALANCQKHHFSAFIRESDMLVVWDDDPNNIIDRAQNIQDRLIDMFWNKSACRNEDELPASDVIVNVRELSCSDTSDLGGTAILSRRPVVIQAFLTAFVIVLLCGALAGAWQNVAIEIKVGQRWTPLAFLVLLPFQCCLGLFFMQSAVQGIAVILGPISQMSANTKYFSGKSPIRVPQAKLPHITIQCPVYKEGLRSVIDPTVKSLKAAISTYEMQGGTANIFVNDDGMQLMSEKQIQERKLYYEEQSIGWVARPRHNPNPNNHEPIFIRGGKFKKASNMNHALRLSNQLEIELENVRKLETKSSESQGEAYNATLAKLLTTNEPPTWAGGNVRVGDYILLVDSDTRVPIDCLLDAVTEMENSPEVAVLQFTSGIMNVTTSWFEKGLTFFTNLVYTCIHYAVANGDVAPFMGHNAFLRWSSIQDVAFDAKEICSTHFSGIPAYWSESTVSEDFDMALRLQAAGYVVRLASYRSNTNSDDGVVIDNGFKEGVSLTVYDEIARWEKYAYGCSELVFHPLVQWPRRGPFTPLFRNFLCSSIPLPSKLTILAYMGNYFSLGSAWILILFNYFIFGWFHEVLDHFYMDSFKIYFSLILVFTILGNVSLAILRHRTSQKNIASSLAENATWIPLLVVFFGGISIHVSQAILCQLFSVDMSWGATAKEVARTSFFKEVPAILKKFRLSFLFCVTTALVIIVMKGIGPLGQLVPWEWRIELFAAIWPLGVIIVSHALLPLVLNPGLMQMTF